MLDGVRIANLESPRRALGTALEWPDAKQRAHQVREWGIEVWLGYFGLVRLGLGVEWSTDEE